MHSLYFVVIPKAQAETAREAISEAEDWLNENDFASEGGFYSSSRADWFQMGGRWSGLLSEVTWAKKATAEIAKLEKENDIQLIGCSYGDKKKTALQAKLMQQAEEIWAKYRPTEYAEVKFQRSMYDNQDDDAMLLTEEVLKALQKKYPKKNPDDGWGDVQFVDTEDFYEDALYKLKADPEKWIVVVDYHS